MSAFTERDQKIRPKGPGIEKLDFLIEDLLAMRRHLGYDGAIGRGVAEEIERNLLLLLESISPEIRLAAAEYERYRAAPKIGGAQ